MKKIFLLLLFLFCSQSWAISFVDLKFSGSQIADTQWNVGSCTNGSGTTCQIYSKSPGPTWNTGSPVYPSATQYIAFTASGNASYPWHMYLYNSNGTVAQDLGIGKILSQGTASDGHSYFFFSNANYNGTLFSTDWGMNNNNGITISGTNNPTVPQTDQFAATGSTTPLSAGQTAAPAAPSLCCGGSSTAFNADANNTVKVQAFVNRTTQDSQVYIEQLGNQSIITVNQTGTKNNYTKYYGNGSNNTINITQFGTSNTQTNYIDASVVGNNNNINLQQTSNGGGKGIFATVNNNSNTLLVQQKDSGSHYTDVSLSGGNKNVDILQQGSASHMAKVTLSGNPTDLSLSQSGSTQNFYSINFNCATAGGCAKITVQQGQ